MATSEIYASGTTPCIGDTKRMLWVKKLKTLGGQALLGDTVRMLIGKCVQARKGLPVKNNF